MDSRPFMEIYSRIIEKMDEALMPLGCKYTIVIK